MLAIWNHKWTALALLTAACSFAWVIATAVDPYPGDTAGERAIIISMFLAGGLAILAGLWLFWKGGRSVLASVAVGLGVVPMGMIFWLLLPTIIAIAIVVGGIARGGLRRELSVAPEASAPATAT